MKKVYISILLFFLVFHYIIPCFFYFTYGFVNIYSNLYDFESIIKGFLLNFISIIGAIFFVAYLPDKRQQVEPVYQHTTKFYSIAAFFVIIPFILYGGFAGALRGAANSSVFSFLKLFFDFSTAIFFALFLQRKVLNVFYLFFLYIFILTFTGSRSAVIFIFLLVLMYPMFSNSNIYRPIVLKYFKMGLLISPILFIIGTSTRTQKKDEGLHKISYVGEKIIGRISFLELNMIAISKTDNKTADIALFENKYGASNQLKQIVNAASPIDPFIYDIDPNQYFRAIFLGYTEKEVRSSYMSINLSLPVYLYIKYGFIFACVFSILIISGIYCVLFKFRNNIYVVSIILLSL